MERFAAFLQTKKQLSSATVNSYIRDVMLFSDFLEKPAAEGVEKDVEAFIRHLKSEGRSASTIARFLSSLHAYFRYLTQREGLLEDPTENIPRPETERRLPMILTQEEVSRLLSAPTGDSPKAMRDRAMLELLYATGLRVSELISLHVDNVNLRRRMLSLRTASRRRTIPFGRPCAIALSDYIKQARPFLLRGSGTAALFLSCNGAEMSRQGFWKLMKHYKKIAGIDKEITPHMLRHSLAAHLLENGASAAAIQEMMGFTDPSSTAIYTKIIENKIMDIYDKAHPRANL